MSLQQVLSNMVDHGLREDPADLPDLVVGAVDDGNSAEVECLRHGREGAVAAEQDVCLGHVCEGWQRQLVVLRPARFEAQVGVEGDAAVLQDLLPGAEQGKCELPPLGEEVQVELQLRACFPEPFSHGLEHADQVLEGLCNVLVARPAVLHPSVHVAAAEVKHEVHMWPAAAARGLEPRELLLGHVELDAVPVAHDLPGDHLGALAVLSAFAPLQKAQRRLLELLLARPLHPRLPAHGAVPHRRLQDRLLRIIGLDVDGPAGLGLLVLDPRLHHPLRTAMANAEVGFQKLPIHSVAHDGQDVRPVDEDAIILQRGHHELKHRADHGAHAASGAFVHRH
mmetsp:Transcript_7774/g.29161  ORF Transcript_7774/g.29161 Transcript_7774/m.29161 type:complete len:338 (-) Transcript_7774:260-1273(-)